MASQACTNGTAAAPSPDAAATRFIESTRMSPAAKIPGTVVSSAAGGTPSRQPLRRHVAARDDEAAGVAGDLVRQVVRAGLGAEQQHETGGLDPLLVPVRRRAG